MMILGLETKLFHKKFILKGFMLYQRYEFLSCKCVKEKNGLNTELVTHTVCRPIQAMESYIRNSGQTLNTNTAFASASYDSSQDYLLCTESGKIVL